RAQQVAGDDRDLVAAVDELAGLAVDVLGDPPERWVVEVRHDRDPHGADATEGIAAGTLAPSVPTGPGFASVACDILGLHADLRVPMHERAQVRGAPEDRRRPDHGV